MSIQIKVSFSPGSVKIMKHFASIAKDTKEGIRRANYLIGKELEKNSKLRILKGKKTGRLYLRRQPSGRIVRHRASAPGEAPANFTGSLRASVSFIVKGQQLIFGAGGTVLKGRKKGKFVNYARELELGNRARKLAARPYLIAAIKDEEKIVRNFYKQYIKKALTKKGI